MLEKEILVLYGKIENERSNINYRLQRILQIHKGLLEGFSKVHLVSSCDARQIKDIAIPSNLIFHKAGVWHDRNGYVRFFFHLLYLLRSIRYAIGLLKRNRNIFLIMNLSSHDTQGVLAVILSQLFGRKSVVRLSNNVDSGVFVFKKKYGKILGAFYSALIHSIERLVLDRADAIISVSPIALEEYPQYRSKIFLKPVLTPALDKYRHKKLNEKKLRKFFHLFFAGRLEPEKGVDLLLEALVGLEGVKCSIAGDGSMKDRLKEKAIELQLQDIIDFHGLLQQDRLFVLMEKSDALVLPSYYEYTPNVLIEATVIGLPVIASDVGGVRYLIENGKTGLLFKNGDKNDFRKKILFLKNNPDVREHIRTQAKKHFLENYFHSQMEAEPFWRACA